MTLSLFPSHPIPPLRIPLHLNNSLDFTNNSLTNLDFTNNIPTNLDFTNNSLTNLDFTNNSPTNLDFTNNSPTNLDFTNNFIKQKTSQKIITPLKYYDT